MLTWREEGESGHDKRHVAMLGEEVEVGYVLASKSWGFKWYSMLAPNDLAYSTLSAAKAALAEAVGGWCARAGLVPQVPETYPATTGTTATHPTEMRGWIKEPMKLSSDQDALSALAQARKDAFEECAKIVETALVDDFERRVGQRRDNSEAEVFLAASIRALITKGETG